MEASGPVSFKGHFQGDRGLFYIFLKPISDLDEGGGVLEKGAKKVGTS